MLTWSLVIELHVSLSKVPAGNAQISFDQDDSPQALPIRTTVALTIQGPPPTVDAGKPQTATLDDAFVHLTGSGFQHVRAVRFDGATYDKDQGSIATGACFSGPPVGVGQTAGETLSAQLLESDGTAGEDFPLTLQAPRPQLAIAAPTAGTTHVASAPLTLTLAAPPLLPAHFSVRVRRARPEPTLCDTVTGDGVDVPAAQTRLISNSQVAVTLDAARLLSDGAFGTLQLQLVDNDDKTASAWVDVPGTFVRTAPSPTPAPIVSPTSPGPSPAPSV